MPNYKYTMQTTGRSSQKYGPCEVCGKHVSEVFHQVEEAEYPGGWTQEDCSDAFGHEACLLRLRRISTGLDKAVSA